MDRTIAGIDAYGILDSRGHPTLRVVVGLADSSTGTASVPAGASTGRLEAVELRDGDPGRYDGRGVLKAIANIRNVIAPRLIGLDAARQGEIDRLMIDLDGTENKARLGANAIVGVSMAVARAAAAAAGEPLYRFLGGPGAATLPVPMLNVINGGKHAHNTLSFQEFMLVPLGAPRFAEALRFAAETFHALKRELERRGYATGVGDEGGFAPDLESNEEACELIVDAIRDAGYEPGTDIAIALDPAASNIWEDGSYRPGGGDGPLSASEMTNLFARWCSRYPIVSIEDGLDETDWTGFSEQTRRLGDRIQIVGDDLYVTNTRLIRRGIAEHATNAVLIKPNQIGTLTETIEAIELCRSAGLRYVISHRSGETEDSFIADFAVAMGGGQIKTGSVTRSERVAKYNRLIEIERELGSAAVWPAVFDGWHWPPSAST
ncbi:MAG TPA: phosphopyruvate hydratase [Hyphomicrobiales bacterium]|nr:phosphopyruvate hydratase [Hyphomicrobiales bacterium]